MKPAAAGIERLLTMSLKERHTLSLNVRPRYTLGAIVDQYRTSYETLMIEKGIG